jgi:hypothetical protein
MFMIKVAGNVNTFINKIELFVSIFYDVSKYFVSVFNEMDPLCQMYDASTDH